MSSIWSQKCPIIRKMIVVNGLLRLVRCVRIARSLVRRPASPASATAQPGPMPASRRIQTRRPHRPPCLLAPAQASPIAPEDATLLPRQSAHLRQRSPADFAQATTACSSHSYIEFSRCRCIGGLYSAQGPPACLRQSGGSSRGRTLRLRHVVVFVIHYLLDYQTVYLYRDVSSTSHMVGR